MTVVNVKKIKNFIFPGIMLAQETDWDQNLTGSDPGPVGFSYIEKIFGYILNLAVSAAGIAVFVMLLVGGFKYLMAQGDPKAAESARGTLTWAIVGLFILIGAWFILKLIEQFTGLNLSTFSIKFPE